MLQTGTINLYHTPPRVRYGYNARIAPPEGRIVIHVPLPQFFRAEVPEKEPFHLLCLIPE